MLPNRHLSRPQWNHPMISMSNAVVHGGYFSQIITDTGGGRKEPFNILMDAVAHTAFHNSAARSDPPRCLPNTRVAVLNKIMDWLRRRDSDTWDFFIMWLTGAAGAGKSAIAQSFIELCLGRNDLVLASFFFGRSDGTRNHAGAFVATLAYQIYDLVPDVRPEIISVIDSDPFVFTRSLEHQFIELVAKPLDKVLSLGVPWGFGSCRVIVIDGLEECLDREVQRRILSTIAKSIREFNLPVLFLIASRPEHDINVVFGSKEMTGIYTRLYLDESYNPDDDIRIFLQHSFDDIKNNHPYSLSIPTSWPDPTVIESLVQRSSGQFIFAVTVIRYVQSIRHQPRHRLDVIMNLRQPQDDLPFTQLDTIYWLILSTARDIKQVLYALSVYSHGLVQNSGYFNISQFMSLEDESDLDILFCDMQALVSVEAVESNNGKRIRTLKVLHASLHNYLMDPTRSQEFFLDIQTYRTEHIANILHYIGLHHDDRDLTFTQNFGSLKTFFQENFSLCESSSALVQQASIFPISQALNSSTQVNDVPAKEFFCFTLLIFIKHMVLLDRQWLQIEKRHFTALDEFLLANISPYYNNTSFSRFTCILCHAGKEKIVPCLYTIYVPRAHFVPFTTGLPDPLMLRSLNVRTSREAITIGHHAYREYFCAFIQDAERSGVYAIDTHTYTQTVLFCIQQLERTVNFNVEGPFDEASLLEQHILENGIWSFVPGNEVPVGACYDFLYLGYIICFLPRSRESEELVQHCQRQTFLTERVVTLFPERTAQVRRALMEYMQRVTGTSPESWMLTEDDDSERNVD